jgi:GT2 family glycosyltransferase
VIRLPAADDPLVSMIVLLDGSAEMAERGLRAIAETGGAVPCETIVLLNDPGPELESLVRNSTSGGRVILSRANAGPGVGWNLGMAVARGSRVATLHEDSEPEPGWLVPLCETMDETGAGAVGARLFNADGSIQNCGWVLFSDAGHQPIRPDTAPEVAATTQPTPADMLSGAATLVDREVVRAAGGWDERFHPAVFMDIDVCTAIWGQGRLVLNVPASRVRHLSGTFDRRPRSALTGPRLRAFLLERNRGPFLEKWGDGVRGLAPPPADPSPEGIRAAVQAALRHTAERAERVRSGAWPTDRRQTAEPLFTGLAEPPVVERGEGSYEVAPQVADALRASEAAIVDEYCRFLIPREEEGFRLLQDVAERRERDLEELHGHIDFLRGENQRLAEQLGAILNSPIRRLRRGLGRILRRDRSAQR